MWILVIGEPSPAEPSAGRPKKSWTSGVASLRGEVN
jgi:hypothetical protein